MEVKSGHSGDSVKGETPYHLNLNILLFKPIEFVDTITVKQCSIMSIYIHHILVCIRMDLSLSESLYQCPMFDYINLK